MSCICLWPDGCYGSGRLHCEGCDGDTCVCECGGVLICSGCDWCEEDPRGSTQTAPDILNPEPRIGTPGRRDYLRQMGRDLRKMESSVGNGGDKAS